ncbi:hypothetical protein WAI453_001027 [Rhynchosporium graminicola]
MCLHTRALVSNPLPGNDPTRLACLLLLHAGCHASEDIARAWVCVKSTLLSALYHFHSYCLLYTGRSTRVCTKLANLTRTAAKKDPDVPA